MHRTLCLALTACAASPTAQLDAPAAADPTLVTVAQGTLQGFADSGVLRWNGVPFAAPPLGALRWRPPAPPASWTGVRDATRYASECTQAPDEVNPEGTPVGVEDCLYLNVTAPAHAAGPLPVIVFVHGGAFITGDSSAPMYNAPELPTEAPAIVVTVNYRLGALGFLALPELAAEDAHGSTGDYGLLDQLAALRWVRDNISAFGGDPERVLLWGHSAGGASTLMLVASPLGRGLFRAAFAQSGGTATGRGRSRAATAGAAYAASLGCTGAGVLACLRALPATAAEALPPDTYQWGPVVDGSVLPQSPPALFAIGAHNHVPVVFGTTVREQANPKARAFPPIATVVDEASYEAALTQNFGAANVATILAHYPATTTPRAAYVAALSDAFMTCPARRMARALAAHQSEPVYRYLFTHTDSAGPRVAQGPAHGVDFTYWFDAFLYFTPTASEHALAATMSGQLAHVAAGGATAPGWPAYAADDPTLVLDDTIEVASDPHGMDCDLWDALTKPLGD